MSSKVNSIRYTDCCNKETNINGGGAFFTGQLCVLNNSNIVINTSEFGTFTIPSVAGTYSSFNGVITFISGCTCIDASGNETNVTTTTTITDVVQSLAPTFELDHIGLKESYFIYWFKEFDTLKLDKLYMRVKFFNGKTGEYTTFTTQKQTSIDVNKPFRINNDYFYREVTFDFVNYLYDVIGSGKSLLTLDWYEYINPPQNNS